MARLLGGLCLGLLLMSCAAGCGVRVPPSDAPKGDSSPKADGTSRIGAPPEKKESERPPESKDARPKEKEEPKAKAAATINLIFPDEEETTELKVDGKKVELNDEAAKQGKWTAVIPGLEAGKTYTYKVEATIEPNNYTKIVRTRTATVKGGEAVTVDLTRQDKKIKDNVIIRWVPTPKVVVEDMCKLAKVGPNDVVMDPGCGDGIMVVTAVKDFKAKRGKGTDLDPEKVKEAQKAAEKAGVKDKVVIKQGNALELKEEDLKDVTVLMIYMGDELDVLLRPTLWKYLPAGARVVSHRFLMGDWAPDKSVVVNREGEDGPEDFHLHVWTITGKEKLGEYKKRPAPKDE